MFGWINDCCESLVVTKFGREKWHEIKEKAGCTVEDGGFIRHQYYTDESSIQLVVALSEVLGLSVEAVLETFGQYFMEFTRDAGYDNMLSCQGSNLRLWLSNLNALHDHLQDTLPEGKFPEFWCEDDTEVKGGILLYYHSTRGSLFVPFVVGLVKEIARYHFDLEIIMERIQMQGEADAEYTSWRIYSEDPADLYKLTSSVRSRSRGYLASDGSKIEEALRDADIMEAAEATGCPFRTMQHKAKAQTISEKAAERFWNARQNDNVVPSNEGDLRKLESERQPELKTEESIQKESLTPPSFMSNENMKEIFPYHVVVDIAFEILQVGKDLPRILGESSSTLIGQNIQELFEINRPALAKWEWDSIQRFQDQTLFLRYTRPIRNLSKPRFKAHFIKLSSKPKRVLFVISPDVKNIGQLNRMQLTMSDLPSYTFQRDTIFLGEHMYSGIRSAHKLDKLSRKLANEHELSNTLLYSMLPREVAERLRSGKTFEPTHHDNVTLFFSDVVGFTNMCSELPPWDIIDMLNRLYTVMDYLAATFNLYKVETIGDAYMCCSGLPELNEFHAEDVANFSIAVRECVSLVKSPLTNQPIRVRIGVHSGSCMSGVVGTLTPHYCLFGDMINTTSRHESTGEPDKIHCSSVTRDKLISSNRNSEHYNFTPRGLVDMKGKGKLFTYWLDAGELNPHVGASSLQDLVEEVQEMLDTKTWKKRSYFKKRASSSTISTTNFDTLDNRVTTTSTLNSTEQENDAKETPPVEVRVSRASTTLPGNIVLEHTIPRKVRRRDSLYGGEIKPANVTYQAENGLSREETVMFSNDTPSEDASRSEQSPSTQVITDISSAGLPPDKLVEDDLLQYLRRRNSMYGDSFKIQDNSEHASIHDLHAGTSPKSNCYVDAQRNESPKSTQETRHSSGSQLAKDDISKLVVRRRNSMCGGSIQPNQSSQISSDNSRTSTTSELGSSDQHLEANRADDIEYTEDITKLGTADTITSEEEVHRKSKNKMARNSDTIPKEGSSKNRNGSNNKNGQKEQGKRSAPNVLKSQSRTQRSENQRNRDRNLSNSRLQNRAERSKKVKNLTIGQKTRRPGRNMQVDIGKKVIQKQSVSRRASDSLDRLSIPPSRSSTNTGGGKGKAKVVNVKENMIINGSSNRKAKLILNSSNAMVAASNNARKERHKTSKKSATKKETIFDRLSRATTYASQQMQIHRTV